MKVSRPIQVCLLGALVACPGTCSTGCKQAAVRSGASAHVPLETAAASNPEPPRLPPPAAAGTGQPVKPLLLLEEQPASTPLAGPQADNSRCLVCHLNLEAEELTATHARANVGCARCHGESDAHIADESWASGGNGTAPDRMYPPDKINPLCLECHPRDKLSPDQHKTLFAGSAPPARCTECHGQHRLVTRRCKWK